MPFVKLDCGIIHSSLWAESSDTKVCWITLLLLADATGFVRAAASAIAREAGIPADVARQSLELFASPDDESRTPDNQGKRIEKVDGGYRVLNYEKYRERDYTNAERQKRFREKERNVTAVTSPLRSVTKRVMSRRVTHADADADADADKKTEGANGSRPTVEFKSFTDIDDWLKTLVADPTYKGINVRQEYGKMLNWCNVNKKQPTQRRFINWINRAEKPLPRQHSATVDYKRNYALPQREVTDAEFKEAQRIAREETSKLREQLTAKPASVVDESGTPFA